MSIDQSHIQHIFDIMHKNGYSSLCPYLPTPEFVRQVIFLTNNQEASNALAFVCRSEETLNLIEEKIDDATRIWFQDIIDMLRQAILAKQ